MNKGYLSYRHSWVQWYRTDEKRRVKWITWTAVWQSEIASYIRLPVRRDCGLTPTNTDNTREESGLQTLYQDTGSEIKLFYNCTDKNIKEKLYLI